MLLFQSDNKLRVPERIFWSFILRPDVFTAARTIGERITAIIVVVLDDGIDLASKIARKTKAKKLATDQICVEPFV